MTTKCERSKHVVVERKYGFESFGKRNTKSSTVNAARECDISKLYSLFQRSNVFPANPTVKRKMTENLFWGSCGETEKGGI